MLQAKRLVESSTNYSMDKLKLLYIIIAPYDIIYNDMHFCTYVLHGSMLMYSS
jgi:hypothetical protein